jgi:hypothetical protein
MLIREAILIKESLFPLMLNNTNIAIVPQNKYNNLLYLCISIELIAVCCLAPLSVLIILTLMR